MMFDVGYLFGKEEIEVNQIFGALGIFSSGITRQVEQSSVFNGKVCRAKDCFISAWIFYIFGE